MKLNKSVFVVLSFIFQIMFAATASASWNGKIFRAVDGEEVTREEFLFMTNKNKIIVMGETHMIPEVQNAEASIIRDIVTLNNNGNINKPNFVFAWEFLAYNQQTLVNTLWDKLIKGNISAEEFIKLTLGNGANNTYIPVLKTVAELGGKLIGLNLTREEKAPVTKGGIKAADPKLIPPGYEIGGPNYLARFEELMGDHTTPDKVANYFDAQCLTDDVMAHEVSKISNVEKIFVVAGHFHTDFFDGFVQRLETRLPNEAKIVIRIIDASEFKEGELLSLLYDPKYGQLADYAYFVKEPIAANKKSY